MAAAVALDQLVPPIQPAAVEAAWLEPAAMLLLPRAGLPGQTVEILEPQDQQQLPITLTMDAVVVDVAGTVPPLGRLPVLSWVLVLVARGEQKIHPPTCRAGLVRFLEYCRAAIWESELAPHCKMVARVSMAH
jgi:hypothetical protein